MADRPYVLLSAAMSVDGYLDDATGTRLLLSNEDDFDAVDQLRAGVDAILVGANTIRRDDPRLVLRSERRRATRQAEGRAESPLKVTLTASGRLDETARFFAAGPAGPLVYTSADAEAAVAERLGGVATVVGLGEQLGLPALLADLAGRGVRRLLVEGGTEVLTGFLTAGLADELRLAIAPFFVGDPAAPRLVHSGLFSHGAGNPMRLAELRRIGDLAVCHYALSASAADQFWLRQAVELSRSCPPTDTAFNVGAIVVDADGVELARGYSRETDAVVHAEESALAKLDLADPRLASATLYSSLEPCSTRKSRPRSCTQLIIDAGIPRVVFALREPPVFVRCDGTGQLRTAGVAVVELPDLADDVRAVNHRVLATR